MKCSWNARIIVFPVVFKVFHESCRFFVECFRNSLRNNEIPREKLKILALQLYSSSRTSFSLKYLNKRFTSWKLENRAFSVIYNAKVSAILADFPFFVQVLVEIVQFLRGKVRNPAKNDQFWGKSSETSRNRQNSCLSSTFVPEFYTRTLRNLKITMKSLENLQNLVETVWKCMKIAKFDWKNGCGFTINTDHACWRWNIGVSLGVAPDSKHNEKNEELLKFLGKPIEFSTFLDICKDEQNSPDPLTEIIKALSGLDRYYRRSVRTEKGIL